MIFLGLFIFFIFLLAYYRKKGLRDQENIEEAFWERENEANHVRRKDISSLPYITIPLEKFPINICDDPKLIACEAKLKQLSDCRILNLEHQSNTDLKMLYGSCQSGSPYGMRRAFYRLMPDACFLCAGAVRP